MERSDLPNSNTNKTFVTDGPTPHLLDEKTEKGEGLWNALITVIFTSIILIFTMSSGFPPQKVLSTPERNEGNVWPEQRVFVDRNPYGSVPTRSEAQGRNRGMQQIYIGPEELENG